MKTESDTEDEFITFLSPVSADDFWSAKSILESAEIPFKVTGKLQPEYYCGGKLQIGSTTEITIKRKDIGRAELVCMELLEKEKQTKEKWAKTKPTMMQKFFRFFRLW